MNYTVTSPRGTTYLRINDHPYTLTQRQLPARSNSDPNPLPDRYMNSEFLTVPQLTKNSNVAGNGSVQEPHSVQAPRKLTEKRKIKLLLTYGGDWALTIIILGLFYLLDSVEGFKREFSLNDTTIQHTFAVHERVPPWALYVIAYAAPAILMPLFNLLTVRSWWDWHNSWLGLLLSVGSTACITQLVKVTVGNPRPDLLDRCQPRAGAADAVPFGLVTADICTTDNHQRLRSGFQSFFSGHASASFAGLGFLSFYLAGKMHLFDQRGHTGKAWLSLAPLIGALLVAISRTMDYRHHWYDVLVGSVIGLAIAYFCYRQYYPNLASQFSHRPYSPRIPRYQQDEAGIPSADAPPAPAQSGSGPAGESIELAGTVKREGEPLSQVWKGDRKGARAQNQREALASGDKSQNV